jgi:hypothetical protein
MSGVLTAGGLPALVNYRNLRGNALKWVGSEIEMSESENDVVQPRLSPLCTVALSGGFFCHSQKTLLACRSN